MFWHSAWFPLPGTSILAPGSLISRTLASMCGWLIHLHVRFSFDADVSPRTFPAPRVPSTSTAARGSIAPWEQEDDNGRSGMPRDTSISRGLGFGNVDNSVVPGPWRGQGLSTQSASNWPPGPPVNTAQVEHNRQMSTMDTSPTSLRFPSMVSPTDSDGASFRDDRRPSVASNGTLGSMGSMLSSYGQPRTSKKLHDFFGVDTVPSAEDARQSSIASLPTPTEEYDENGRPLFKRNLSFGNSAFSSQRVSPSPSLPKAPDVSSEVTPWMFQDPEV